MNIHTHFIKREENRSAFFAGTRWITINRTTLQFDWRMLNAAHFFHIHFRFTPYGDPNQLSFAIGIPSLFWFHFGSTMRRKWTFPYDYEREIGVSYHDKALWWRTWSPASSWSRKTPKWRDGNLDFERLVKGRAKHSEEDIETVSVQFVMPEATYPATIRMYKSIWAFPRWPAKVITRAEVTIENGIPIPGKGENSWDLDDDAIYESSFVASSWNEAYQKFLKSVQDTRFKYGGRAWKPNLSETK